MSNKQYSIKATPLVMSKINKLLKNIDLNYIPEEGEDFELFAQAILLDMYNNPDELNTFFQTITNTSDNFEEKEVTELEVIMKDFFQLLGPSFMKLMRTRKNVYTKQEQQVTDQTMKLVMQMVQDGKLKIPGMQE